MEAISTKRGALGIVGSGRAIALSVRSIIRGTRKGGRGRSVRAGARGASHNDAASACTNLTLPADKRNDESQPILPVGEARPGGGTGGGFVIGLGTDHATRCPFAGEQSTASELARRGGAAGRPTRGAGSQRP